MISVPPNSRSCPAPLSASQLPPRMKHGPGFMRNSMVTPSHDADCERFNGMGPPVASQPAGPRLLFRSEPFQLNQPPTSPPSSSGFHVALSLVEPRCSGYRPWLSSATLELFSKRQYRLGAKAGFEAGAAQPVGRTWANAQRHTSGAQCHMIAIALRGYQRWETGWKEQMDAWVIRGEMVVPGGAFVTLGRSLQGLLALAVVAGRLRLVNIAFCCWSLGAVNKIGVGSQQPPPLSLIQRIRMPLRCRSRVRHNVSVECQGDRCGHGY